MTQNEEETEEKDIVIKTTTQQKPNETPTPPTITTISPPELPLDWTNINNNNAPPPPARVLRYPWDVVITSEDEPLKSMTELTIVGTAGQKITVMGGGGGSDDSSSPSLYDECHPRLSSLILRSHLIKKMEGGLYRFEELEHLELYDNMIEWLEDLNDNDDEDGGRRMMKLKVLDMSYNVIRDMEPVRFCPNLVELYLANNKLKSIRGLDHLSKLKKMDLGANRIRVMEGLSGLTNLEELWLGKNKIEIIDGLEALTKLRRLDVQSNRLTSITNLTSQTSTLEELYLAHNAITTEGASTLLQMSFTCLNTIDLSRNRLVDTSPFASLNGTLEELWLSGNVIRTFDDVEVGMVGGMSKLEGIYLEYNPVSKEFDYRKRLVEMVPSLKQIDADMVGGLGSDGGGGGVGLAERMREMQDLAIKRAKEQAVMKETGS